MLLTTLPVRPVRTNSLDRRFDRTFAQFASLALGAGAFHRRTSSCQLRARSTTSATM